MNSSFSNSNSSSTKCIKRKHQKSKLTAFAPRLCLPLLSVTIDRRRKGVDERREKTFRRKSMVSTRQWYDVICIKTSPESYNPLQHPNIRFCFRTTNNRGTEIINKKKTRAGCSLPLDVVYRFFSRFLLPRCVQRAIQLLLILLECVWMHFLFGTTHTAHTHIHHT